MKNMQAPLVTKDEILNKYQVELVAFINPSWLKVIKFTDTNSGKVFAGNLYWNSSNGYVLYIEPSFLRENPDMKNLMERPELEYLLDSITNDKEKEYASTKTNI